MKRLLYLCLLILVAIKLPAQQKVIIESFRSYSMFGPTMHYLEDPAIQQNIKSKISKLLQNYYNLGLVDENLPVEVHTNAESLKNKKADFKTTDTSTWHLFLELYEYDPKTFLAGSDYVAEDSAIIAASKSVFQLSALLANPTMQIISDQNIYAAITTSPSNGGGVSPKNIFLTKKSFGSLVQVGLQIALDSANQTALVEIKAPPVYYADNFTLNTLRNPSKIDVNESKNAWVFYVQGNLEALRMDEQLYDEIWVKRKLVDSSASTLLINKIKETGNTATSDFIYLRQECRDVYQDKNYTIKVATEIDPYKETNNKKEVFTNFLPGAVHCMLQGKDTAAIFEIKKMVGDPFKQIYIDKTTNGIDSSSTAKISDKDFTVSIFYDYQLIGKIRDESFCINIFWNHEMKELYLNNQFIGLAKGNTTPENFILLNGFNNTNLIKELLLIAYNKFLL